MQPSRRSFGALLAGGLAASFSGAARAAPSSTYPALAQLAALLQDRPGCKRLAEAGLAKHFDGARLRQIDRGIATALAKGERPSSILGSHNTADFRAGRTVKAGGFLLAETEAAAALLRARPNHA